MLNGLLSNFTIICIVLLFVGSALSWHLMIAQMRMTCCLMSELKSFEHDFNKKADIAQLYRKKAEQSNSGFSEIFVNVIKEFVKLQQMKMSNNEVMSTIKEALDLKIERSRLPFRIGCVGRTALINLYFSIFAAIMALCCSLWGLQQFNIALLIPGLIQALILMGAGILAAVPAFIAYSKLSCLKQNMNLRYHTLGQELMVVFAKQLFAK